MSDNILTDAEKLKKVVDMASQQNSKSYEATNPQEFKKAVEEAPKGSTIVYNEMENPKTDNSMLMSKEHYDGINDANRKLVGKQLRKKKEEGIGALREEINELKEIMKMQMEIDKLRRASENPVKAKMMSNTDTDGYIDLTKDTSPMNVIQKEDMILMSPKIQTPKDVVVRNPLTTPSGINVLPSGEVKQGIDASKIVQKKVNKIKGRMGMTVFVVGVIVCFGLFFLGFSTLLKVNYFLSGLFSIVFTFAISLTLYLTKVKVPEHQLPKKEVVHYNNFEMAEMRNCPKCNGKISKSKVIQDGDGFRQHLKCNNLSCDFQKTIEIKKEHGY